MPPADAKLELDPRVGLASAMLVAAAFLLVPLGHGDLTEDAPMYAFVPLRSLASGEYVRLYRDWAGEMPYFNKPPLQFWLTSGVYALFGANIATARLVSALSWLACCGVLFAIVRPRLGTLAATVATALLPIQREVYKNMLGCRLDGGMLLAFLVASLAALKLAEDGRRLKWWLLGGAAIGLGATYRGPYAFAAIGALLAFLAWQSPRRLLDWKGLLVFAGALAVCGGWWWATQYALYGDQFAEMLAKDSVGKHVARSKSLADFLNPYYLQRIPEAYWPVVPGLIAAVFVLRRDGLSPIARLAIAWAAFTFVLIHVTPVRGGRYTLPMAPWLCVLATLGMLGFARPREIARRAMPWAGVAALALVGGLTLAGVEFNRTQDAALREAATTIRPAVGVDSVSGWPSDAPIVYMLADAKSLNLQKACAVRFYTRAHTTEIAARQLRHLERGNYLCVQVGGDRVERAEAVLPLELVAGDDRWRVYFIAD